MIELKLPTKTCGHCVRTYAEWFVVVPGLLAGAFAPTDAWRMVFMAAATAGMVVVMTALWRDARWAGRWATLVVVLLSAANALAFAHPLRM